MKQKTSGKKTSEWAKEVLFDPLEIKNLDWMNYKDGTTLGGFGIMTTPREMAKFGQLVLDSGIWSEKVLVNKSWIKEMTATRVTNMYSQKELFHHRLTVMRHKEVLIYSIS